MNPFPLDHSRAQGKGELVLEAQHRRNQIFFRFKPSPPGCSISLLAKLSTRWNSVPLSTREPASTPPVQTPCPKRTWKKKTYTQRFIGPGTPVYFSSHHYACLWTSIITLKQALMQCPARSVLNMLARKIQHPLHMIHQ